MKKEIRISLLIGSLSILALLTIYFALALYYRNAFSVCTWINGIYCTGKSVEEVNSELLSQVEAPIVIITDHEGKSHEIDLVKADYQEDYMISLQSYMQKQNPYLWIENMIFQRKHKIYPQVSYDVDKLKLLFYDLLPIKNELNKEEEYALTYSLEAGYQIHDTLSERLDVDEAFRELCETLERGTTSLDLRKLSCYYDLPLNEEQMKLSELWGKIDDFQNCDLVYDMGQDENSEKYYFSAGIMAKLLLTEDGIPVLDEDANLVLDENAVKQCVSTIAELYDTYGKDRAFQSTRGDVVVVSGGTYGSAINQKAEVEFLMDNLLKHQMHTGFEQIHIPTYTREAPIRGLNDIGNTYVEVDMTEQMLYYYQDGELMLETAVVTGNMRRKYDTPAGVNFVYNKQKNRILRGPGYASPVDYWMPVNKGIGIHDADWRSEFGGEIYKTNGSHGCINVPPEVMPELYDMVTIGTPVIMFY